MWPSERGRGSANNPSDIRFDRQRQARIEHHSAKGEVVRNVNSFTRGTQLVRLEYMMVWQGVKVPLLTGLASFTILACTLMAWRLQTHDIQLVVMRTLSRLWVWCDLSPAKPVNVTLTSGHVLKMAMANVPLHPDVAAAWSLFLRCLLAALLGATVLTVPITIWFTNMAHERGTDILKERHERGAMLVERDVLVEEIASYNFKNLAGLVERDGRGFDALKVARSSVKTRLTYGFHVPYAIADIPYPFDLERTHGMLIGTTGTGKTTILLRMIEQARERNHRCVIFDLTGVFVQHFYEPGRDFILNPIDNRCPRWSVFADCHNILDFSSAAAALFPSGHDGGDPFWTMSARTLFIEMCMQLHQRGERSNAALIHHLMYAKLKDLNKAMKGTIADPLTSTDSARMAESIRAVVNTQAQILRYLPDIGEEHPEEFSIRKWVADDRKDGSILFVTSNHTHLNVTKPLLSLWMDMAVNAVLETERNAGLKIWFLFDEVHALQRLPALENGLQTARAYGGAFLLGIHSFERLCETYGKEGGTNLAALARTKVILTAADTTTAEFCSAQIGNREVREVDEAYSIGAAMSRDAATITPRTEVKPLILPDDIMNFPSLHGIIKFPEGFPAARIQLVWKGYPEIAPPFDEKRHLTQTVYRPPVPDDEEETDGDAGRENVGAKTVELGRAMDPSEDPHGDLLNHAVVRGDPRDVMTSDAAQQVVIGTEGVRLSSMDDLLSSRPPVQQSLPLGQGSTLSASAMSVPLTGAQGAPQNRDQVAMNEMRTGVAAVDPVDARHHHPRQPEAQPAFERGPDFGIGD
jgi:type IV conjugative transfer system coupling protein TraD